jgi:long-subunit fatty acid transport protein
MKLDKKIFGLILVLIATSVKAQDFNDALRLTEPGYVTSPRALGMGNAYTALSNDFSASLFNPAGFALVKRTEFSGSLNYNVLNNDATLFGNTTNHSNSSTEFNQIGFVFPLPTSQGSFVLGFGFNQNKKFDGAMKFSGFNSGDNSFIQNLTSVNDIIAYETGVSYHFSDTEDATNINGKLNQSGNILQDGSIDSWTFSGAVEFQKNFFLGLSITRIDGDYRRDREYWEDDTYDNYPSTVLLDPDYPETADFQSFYFNDVIKWDIGAWDFTAGFLAQLKNFNLGITLKLPRTYTIKENYYVDANASFGTGQTYYLESPIEYDVEYKITTPMEITAGAAFNRNNLTVSFDAKLIDYTQMKFESDIDSDNSLDESTISYNNSDIKDLFRTVVNLNVGAEYVFPAVGLSIRGGFMYMPSPYKNDPSEYDKKFITLGTGFQTGEDVEINVGYAYGWWKDIGDNYGSNLSRTYQDITHNNLVMGVKFYF